MKKLHPAISTKDDATLGECTETIFRNSFGELSHKTLLALDGLKTVYQIEWQPVVTRGHEDRISHVGLIYPQDCWDIVLKKPQKNAVDRLNARQLQSQFKVVGKTAFLTVFWPIKEFRRIVKTWHDLDAPGATCMAMTRDRGLVCGTLQPF